MTLLSLDHPTSKTFFPILGPNIRSNFSRTFLPSKSCTLAINPLSVVVFTSISSEVSLNRLCTFLNSKSRVILDNNIWICYNTIRSQVHSTTEVAVSAKVVPIDAKKQKGEKTPSEGEGVVLIHRTTNALLEAIDQEFPGSKQEILAKRVIGR